MLRDDQELEEGNAVELIRKAAGETCWATFWPTSGFKKRTFDTVDDIRDRCTGPLLPHFPADATKQAFKISVCLYHNYTGEGGGEGGESRDRF